MEKRSQSEEDKTSKKWRRRKLQKISQMEDNGSSQEDGFDAVYNKDIKFGEYSELDLGSSDEVSSDQQIVQDSQK